MELSFQQELNNLARWSYENRSQININITKYMVITTRHKLYTLHPKETIQIHIGKNPLESVVEHKVLDLIVYRNVTFN